MIRIIIRMDRYSLGQRVKQLRQEKRISQRELGKRAGTSGSYISQLEGGKSPRPGADLLGRIALVLGVSIGELTGQQQSVVDGSEQQAVRILRDIIPDATPEQVSTMYRLLRELPQSSLDRVMAVIQAMIDPAPLGGGTNTERIVRRRIEGYAEQGPANGHNHQN